MIALAVRPGELTVDEDRHPAFERSRAKFILWYEARYGGFDESGLGCGKEQITREWISRYGSIRLIWLDIWIS